MFPPHSDSKGETTPLNSFRIKYNRITANSNIPSAVLAEKGKQRFPASPEFLLVMRLVTFNWLGKDVVT
jgi:hypothetical protein